MASGNLAARAGSWSAHHRRTAIFGWIAFVVIAVMIGQSAGTKHLKDQDKGNGDSRTAARIIARAGLKDRADEQVLIQARGALTSSDPEFRAAIVDVQRRLAGIPYVVALASPLEPSHGGLISTDQRSALVAFQVAGTKDQAQKRVVPALAQVAAAQRAHPALRIEEFGSASSDKALTKAFKDDFRKAEALSIPITLLILLLAFGAIVAATLPIVLGLTAVAAALGIVGLLSHVWPVDEAISSVILLIGLAVGVDYSLFYIRREREERAAGRDPEGALAAAAATSGRAVLISGSTVMVAMAGMYLTGNSTFMSFATGTILVVAIAMIGSITVLPALLSWLGDRIDRGRIPFLARLRRGDGRRGAWAFVIDRVLRRPVLSVVAAGGLLVALAIPALGLHTVDTGVQGLPPNLAVTKTLKRIEAAFPGGALPAQVVIQAKDVTSPAVLRGIDALQYGALGSGLMQEPIDVHVNARRDTAIVSVPLAGTGSDSTSTRALRTLRGTVIPNTIAKVPGATTHVGGLTAGSVDFNDQMKARAPWVFAFVLSLAFCLLLVTFRSIVIPLKAILLNLLSVAAAYGVLVLIFQDGHLQSLLGFKSIGGITAWLPLFLFVILFGLSMDYHVLILSRVREAYDRGMTTENAVAEGIKATAGVVTSAAVVMVAVFGIFATLSTLDFKMMGVGLATAILLDATVVRAVLLPATMKLLGDWNWYLPRWLEWLPKIAHEPMAGAPAGAERLFDMAVAEEDGRVRLTLGGELDAAAAGLVGTRLREIEQRRPRLIVVDVREVEFTDMAGIRELHAASRRAHEETRRLVVVETSEQAEQIADADPADAIETASDPAEVG